MTQIINYKVAVCAAAIVAAGAAQADVTAADVWADWQAQMLVDSNSDLTVGSENMAGGVLTVSDIVFSQDDGTVATEMQMGDLVFEERGDGTVSITMDESYPLVVTTEDDVIVTVDVTQIGVDLIVSGDPDTMRYDLTADSYGFALRDVVSGDITFTGDVSATLNDLTGGYTTAQTDSQRMTAFAMDVGSFDILVDVVIPDGEGSINVDGKITDLTLEGDVSMPDAMTLDNSDSMLVEGFSVDAGYSYNGAIYNFDIDAEGDRTAGAVSTSQGSLQLVADTDRIAYDAQTDDLQVSLSTSELPFPVDMALAQYALGFEMPLSERDEPGLFRLGLDLVDLTISEAIWSMFDPGAALPRDAATIQIDLAGTATPTTDLTMLDDEMPMGSPILLNTLDLNALRIAAMGALVTGTGSFVVDNDDMQTFDGMPRPEGDVTLQIDGLNGLMDRLVETGLVPQDQIMGGRMMLGMFARSVGDDQLETRVEINPEGHVIVNGQRMR